MPISETILLAAMALILPILGIGIAVLTPNPNQRRPNVMPNQFPYTARTDTGATGSFETLESVADWFFRLRAGSNPPEFVSACHSAGWVWEMEFDEFAPDSIYLSKVDSRNSGDS